MTNHKDSFQVQRLEVGTTGRRRREIYGRRSERKARVLDQLELELEELEASATEDELAAEQAADADLDSQVVHAQETVAEAFPGSPAARARGGPGA